MHYRKNAIFVILVFLAIPAIVGGLNYCVDPLQIYRQQQFRHPAYWKDQRYQNAGKINSYLPMEKANCLILGHSQTDNFIPSNVSEAFNWGKCLKLTILGGTPIEQAIMFEKAVNTGSIKHVFWGIGLNFANDDPRIFHKRRDFPHYLYTSNLADDGPYLFNIDILTFSWQVITDDLPRKNWMKDLERLNYWGGRAIRSFVNYSSKKNLEKLHWKNVGKSNATEMAIIDDPFRSTQENLINIITENPKVEFTLFFTPDSYQRYYGNRSRTEKFLRLRKSIVKGLSEVDNARVYGFDNLDFIGGNIKNYKDLIHFNTGINAYILESIKMDKNRLTSENYEKYQSDFLKNLATYQVFNENFKMIPFHLKEEQRKYNKIAKHVRGLD